MSITWASERGRCNSRSRSAPLQALGESPEEHDRDRGEHEVVDEALGQGHPVCRMCRARR